MKPVMSVDDISDAALLDQLRGGNAHGLSELYLRYGQRLLRYCMGLLRDRQAAEDVVHNVFMKLHKGQSGIRNGQSLQSWLFTVARNEALTELSRTHPVELTDAVVWEGGSPESALFAQERTEIIDTALHRLHLPYREVLLLRVNEQLSYEEIAHITGTTVSSVKSRLFKARKALVTVLQPYL
jgi:RNA polymerase sigma-70 factor (ECF subfamily)